MKPDSQPRFGGGRLRPLNVPTRVAVEADRAGRPLAVALRGRRRVVEVVQERWRVDEGWWRADPVSRMYWRLVLDDGRQVTVYQDLLDRGSWWMQRA